MCSNIKRINNFNQYSYLYNQQKREFIRIVRNIMIKKQIKRKKKEDFQFLMANNQFKNKVHS